MAVATERSMLYLLTAEGLVRCGATDRLDASAIVGTALDGEIIREVCQDPFEPRRLYAASTTDVYSSENGGETWDQLAAGGVDYRELWTLAVHPTRPNEVYLGTLPAAVYVSENGGRSFRELASFRQLPDHDRWTFPVPPHTAHIRSIALDARVPDDILVGVEEGGVARSRDRGATWEDVSGPHSETAFPTHKDLTGQSPYQPGRHEPGRVYRDVHQVVRHPTRLDTVYATSGRGTYRTDDAGRSWTLLDNGLPLAYSVLMAVHPAAPDRLFVGAAGNGPVAWKGFRTPRTGPFNTGRFRLDLSEQRGGAKTMIFRSDDAGQSWRALAGGLPLEHPYIVCALQIHPQNPEELIAGYADGSIYLSRDAGESWQRIGVSHPKLFGVRVFTPE
jgi:photosystem II stability/assembly factor-like uncharacterized protein